MPNNTCTDHCVHGGKCRLAAGHQCWHQTAECPEWKHSSWPDVQPLDDADLHHPLLPLPAGMPPSMQEWLDREARICAMSVDEIIVAALTEYRAVRTPDSMIIFRDGTSNHHHRNVVFVEDWQ